MTCITANNNASTLVAYSAGNMGQRTQLMLLYYMYGCNPFMYDLVKGK